MTNEEQREEVVIRKEVFSSWFLLKRKDSPLLELMHDSRHPALFEFVSSDGSSRAKLTIDVREAKEMVAHLNDAIKYAEEAVQEEANEK